jgi:hypothetical protein
MGGGGGGKGRSMNEQIYISSIVGNANLCQVSWPLYIHKLASHYIYTHTHMGISSCI